MKHASFWICALSVLVILALVAFSCWVLDFDKVAIKTISFSVCPKGFLDSIKSKNPSNDTKTYIEKIYSTTDTATEVFSNHPVSQVIEETVLGNIIKRTVSPYGANTKYSNVYINNKCGKNIDVSNMLSSNLTFSVQKSDEPQVLIYHTHATE